jgi:hypothetical protein
MSTTAKELLSIMTVRLKMQELGVKCPAQSVKDATRQLVAQLGHLAPEEAVDVVVVQSDPLQARYIRAKTGQVLAELHS